MVALERQVVRSGSPEALRLSMLAPLMALACLPGLWVGLALVETAEWAMYPLMALTPYAATFWLLSGHRTGRRVLLASGSVLAAAAFVAAAAALVLPLFAVPDVGISGTGVRVLQYGPHVLLLAGSLIARSRSASSALVAWFALWLVALSSILWVEPATYVITDWAQVDAIAGTIAALVAPLVALAGWAGVLLMWLLDRMVHRPEHLV